jgi:hypothetical protein
MCAQRLDDHCLEAVRKKKAWRSVRAGGLAPISRRKRCIGGELRRAEAQKMNASLADACKMRVARAIARRRPAAGRERVLRLAPSQRL